MGDETRWWRQRESSTLGRAESRSLEEDRVKTRSPAQLQSWLLLRPGCSPGSNVCVLTVNAPRLWVIRVSSPPCSTWSNSRPEVGGLGCCPNSLSWAGQSSQSRYGHWALVSGRGCLPSASSVQLWPQTPAGWVRGCVKGIPSSSVPIRRGWVMWISLFWLCLTVYWGWF